MLGPQKSRHTGHIYTQRIYGWIPKDPWEDVWISHSMYSSHNAQEPNMYSEMPCWQLKIGNGCWSGLPTLTFHLCANLCTYCFTFYIFIYICISICIYPCIYPSEQVGRMGRAPQAAWATAGNGGFSSYVSSSWVDDSKTDPEQLSLTASCPLEQKQNKQNSQKTQKAIGDHFAKGQPVLDKQ